MLQTALVFPSELESARPLFSFSWPPLSPTCRRCFLTNRAALFGCELLRARGSAGCPAAGPARFCLCRLRNFASRDLHNHDGRADHVGRAPLSLRATRHSVALPNTHHSRYIVAKLQHWNEISVRGNAQMRG